MTPRFRLIASAAVGMGLAAALAVVALAQAFTPAAPAEGKAQVYFYRQNAAFGSGTQLRVTVDGGAVGTVRARSFLVVAVEPGPRAFSIAPASIDDIPKGLKWMGKLAEKTTGYANPRVDQGVLTAQAGSTYYYELDWLQTDGVVFDVDPGPGTAGLTQPVTAGLVKFIPKDEAAARAALQRLRPSPQ